MTPAVGLHAVEPLAAEEMSRFGRERYRQHHEVRQRAAAGRAPRYGGPRRHRGTFLPVRLTPITFIPSLPAARTAACPRSPSPTTSAVLPTMLGENTGRQRRAALVADDLRHARVEHRIGHVHVLLGLDAVRAAVVGERDTARDPVEREVGVHAGGGGVQPAQARGASGEPLAPRWHADHEFGLREHLIEDVAVPADACLEPARKRAVPRAGRHPSASG